MTYRIPNCSFCLCLYNWLHKKAISEFAFEFNIKIGWHNTGFSLAVMQCYLHGSAKKTIIKWHSHNDLFEFCANHNRGCSQEAAGFKQWQTCAAGFTWLDCLVKSILWSKTDCHCDFYYDRRLAKDYNDQSLSSDSEPMLSVRVQGSCQSYFHQSTFF